MILVILRHRHRQQGLVLSELGGHLLPPDQAPAGTKRISNLLRSPRWAAAQLCEYLWGQADQRVGELGRAGELALAIWDESVLEKPESLHLAGLGPVRSAKAARLKRIKPGFFNPPGGRPIMVPGFHWLQVLVTGLHGPPRVAHLRWWTTRGAQASDRRTQARAVLRHTADRWGANVIHVWDRGFAGQPWLTLAYVHAVRFVLRWRKDFKLLDDQGRLRKPGELSRGRRSWEHRYLYDTRRRCRRKTGVIAFPVTDPVHHQPLWLVVSRPKGRPPWYLLTNQPIRSPEDAWQIVFIYLRRWQVEMALRFDKCELAFESPRVQAWETQQRLLLITTLAYAFLVSLLDCSTVDIVTWLLRHWCHRTGEWQLTVKLPLYRLRLALSQLWLTHPPPLLLRERLSSG